LLRVVACCLAVFCLLSSIPAAQRQDDVVRVRAPRIALTHVRVIDGTGRPAVENRTIIIENGRIVAMGATAGAAALEGAETMDLGGHTVIPGLVGMHNHLFYAVPPGRPEEYVSATRTFPRLYLAAGVTTLRTAGTFDLAGDAQAKRRIDAGDEPGPELHLTGAYFHRGPGPADAGRIEREIQNQMDAGATSFKAYTSLRREELGALVDGAHRRGLRVTGHLCAVSFREAAELGIDSVDHGLWTDSGVFPGRTPGRCPDFTAIGQIVAGIDLRGPMAQQIITDLVERRVAVVSTLAILESLAARSGVIDVRMRHVLAPSIRDQWESTSVGLADQRSRYAMWERVLRQEMLFERLFAAAGGLLLAGADPTGWGCCVAGFMDQRNIELLVEAGFTAEQAIRIYSANGAGFMSIADRIGTLAVGKQADLVVIRGNPSARIEDIRNVALVFRNGVGYDPQKLVDSVAGRVGIAEHRNPIMQLLANAGLHPIVVRVIFFGASAIALVILLAALQSWMTKRRRARKQS
jgi:imidazolonepropionase-like amidohydrolase